MPPIRKLSDLLVLSACRGKLNEPFGFGAPFAQITFSEEYEIVLEPALKCRPVYLARSQLRTQDDGTLGRFSAQPAHSAMGAKFRKILMKHQEFRRMIADPASGWRRNLRVSLEGIRLGAWCKDGDQPFPQLF